jgi:predicted peptidase
MGMMKWQAATFLALAILIAHVPKLHAGEPDSQPSATLPATMPATRPADYIAITLPDPNSLPASPGFFLIQVNASAGDREFPMTVGLFLPASYFQSDAVMPTVVALHNTGVKGLGGHGLTSEGIAALWAQDRIDARAGSVTRPATQPIESLRRWAPFVGIAPQCPRALAFEAWPMPQLISELVTQLATVYRLDEQRLYLTGFSYGGTCSLKIAEQMPDRYAAIAPISPRASNTPRKAAMALKSVPIYLACGSDDWALPLCRKLNEGLTITQHPDFVYRELTGGTHWCYPFVYRDPEFWNWMFSHRARAAATQPGAAE